MHVSLDLTSSKWHFKRASRTLDGSWTPALETIQKSSEHVETAQQQKGSSDTRLDSWMPVEVIPNDPFLLLQAAGIIPDPAIGLNEELVQCEL